MSSAKAPLPPAIPWQAFLALISTDLDAVKTSLKAIIPPQTDILADSISGSLNSGGKYLRPAITLLSGKALSESNSASKTTDANLKMRHLSDVAAVSEMIHVATLLHDDVLDEADLRRGKTTIRAALGNKISVLSGDYLLAQASLKLAQLGNTRLVSIYAQVLADLCDGEVAQMTGSYDLASPIEQLWERYRHKTYCKTASLFAAGCEAAGVVYGLCENDIQALRNFGTQFGMAFQVADDLLDYTSSEETMGKPVLGDLRHGLLNAPILLALTSNHLSQDEQKALANDLGTILARSPQDIEDAQLSPVLAWLEKAQAIAKTRDLIEEHTQNAIGSLAFLPESDSKTALTRLAQGVSSRNA
ncbi:MAG: polyprenyl synthetase family protein [Vampirovibrionales bacterium]|nr:polyprenyl synthetase family protein [Vampirovibrionales bacterium]